MNRGLWAGNFKRAIARIVYLIWGWPSVPIKTEVLMLDNLDQLKA